MMQYWDQSFGLRNLKLKNATQNKYGSLSEKGVLMNFLKSKIGFWLENKGMGLENNICKVEICTPNKYIVTCFWKTLFLYPS